MTLKAASKLLSQKLFDPVQEGSDAGRLYTAEMRSGYLNRAIKSMARILLALHQETSEVYKSYFQLVNLGDAVYTTEDIKISLIKDSVQHEKPLSVYYAESDGGTANKRASELNADDYLNVKNGLNSHYAPNASNRYWSLIDNNLYFLPHNLSYYEITLIKRNSFSDISEDTELPFSELYDDLFLLLATPQRENCFLQ